MKSRAVQLFEEYIQSERTRECYSYQLQRFVNYYKLDSFDSILNLKTDDLKEKLEDYVISFKNDGKSPNYIRVIVFAIQSFCDSNDKMGINWKKIRKLLGKKQRPKKSRPYTTSEIKRMLHSSKSLRNKALILFLSSSGVRRGAIPDLRMKDLKQMSHGCVSVTVYNDSDEEYVTFINKEANDTLSLYFEQRKYNGESFTPNSFVFHAIHADVHGDPKPLNEKSISNLILRCKINAGVNFDDSPNLLCHAFRRRFNTILKLNPDSNAPLIERLMGHDMKLDNSYFQPTLDNLFEEYQKGMSDLAIDDSERLMAERETIQAERTQLELEIQHNKNLESRMNSYEKNQEEMIRVMNMIKNGSAVLVDMNDEQIKVKLKQK